MLNNAVAIFAPQGPPPSTNAYESIATVTVGSGGASTVTFSSIPSTYKHLQIRYFLKANAFAAWNQVRYNSDSGNNYTYHELYGTGSSVGAGNSTGVNGWNFNYNNSGTAFNVGVIDILDYANTNKYTTSRNLHGYDENGSGVVALTSGLWLNTAAISQIDLVGGTSFLQYSSFALYGIKG